MGTAKRIKDNLPNKYKMSDLREVRRFLGLEVEKDENGGYHLGQETYINDIVKRFQLEDAHPVHSPMDSNVNLNTEPGNECINRDISQSLAHSCTQHSEGLDQISHSVYLGLVGTIRLPTQHT
jgi:hypothetical protein